MTAETGITRELTRRRLPCGGVARLVAGRRNIAAPALAGLRGGALFRARLRELAIRR